MSCAHGVCILDQILLASHWSLLSHKMWISCSCIKVLLRNVLPCNLSSRCPALHHRSVSPCSTCHPHWPELAFVVYSNFCHVGQSCSIFWGQGDRSAAKTAPGESSCAWMSACLSCHRLIFMCGCTSVLSDPALSDPAMLDNSRQAHGQSSWNYMPAVVRCTRFHTRWLDQSSRHQPKPALQAKPSACASPCASCEA